MEYVGKKESKQASKQVGNTPKEFGYCKAKCVNVLDSCVRVSSAQCKTDKVPPSLLQPTDVLLVLNKNRLHTGVRSDKY